MSRILCCAAALLFLFAPAAQTQIFKGTISDSGCGLKHMMAEATPKQCTLKCVEMGAKFVLADAAHQKVYALSDQDKARPFAGEAVVVTGALKGSTIQVQSITEAR